MQSVSFAFQPMQICCKGNDKKGQPYHSRQELVSLVKQISYTLQILSKYVPPEQFLWFQKHQVQKFHATTSTKCLMFNGKK